MAWSEKNYLAGKFKAGLFIKQIFVYLDFNTCTKVDSRGVDSF